MLGHMENCEKCNGMKESSVQYLKHVAYHEPEKVMKKVQSALNILVASGIKSYECGYFEKLLKS